MTDPLAADIARYSEVQVRKLYVNMLRHSAEDEIAIETLAKRVLDPDWVDNGDGYCVPGIVGIVEKLVGEIERLRAP